MKNSNHGHFNFSDTTYLIEMIFEGSFFELGNLFFEMKCTCTFKILNFF